MKIALVQDWLNGFAGGEQVLLAVHELFPEAPIFTSVYNSEKTGQFKQAKVIPSYLQKIPGLKSHHQIAIPLMPAAFESFDLKGFDVVFSIGGGLSKGVITHPGQVHISYNNTPLRYIWRLSQDNRNAGRWDSWLRESAAHRLRMWDVISAERVDYFLANSKTSAGRVKKIYRRESEVLYPPVDTGRFQVGTEKAGNYFLSVGRLIAYKRVDLVIQACILTKQPLKIVGRGPEEKALRKLAEGSAWIEFLGHVSNQELSKLYAEARAFVFGGEEDFGIVAVEAMACGRPVIAYGKGGITESVIEGKTGTFFEDATAESMAALLEKFNPDEYDSGIIRTRAEQFDVKVFKEGVKTVIQQVTH